MRRGKCTLLAAAALLAAGLLPRAGAQEAAEQQGEKVKKALAAWKQDAHVTGSVTVSIKKTGGMGGNIIRVGASEAEPFQGKIEFWRDATGPLVLVTPQELHGFGVYVGEDGTYVSATTLAGALPDLDQVTRELPALLDPARLLKWARKADWKASGNKLTAELSPRAVPAKAAAIAGMVPTILHVEAELTLDAVGKPVKAKFAVVRNDPTPQLIAQGGGVPQGVQIPQGDPDAEAERTVYTVKFDGAAPPRGRAASFRERVETLLENEEE